MCDLVSDLILRIGQADGDTLRDIFHQRIEAPIWTHEEREILLNAFGNRAETLNREAIGMTAPRWSNR